MLLSTLRILHGSHSDWKNWKTGEHFPVRQKLGNFAETGKVREFYPKYWKDQKKNYTGKLQEKLGKFVSL